MKLSTCYILEHASEAENGQNYSDRLIEKAADMLEPLIRQCNLNRFITGVNTDNEISCAEAVIRLRRRYPQISLECVLHSELQAIAWSERKRARFFGVLALADRELYYYRRQIENGCVPRNRYMLEQSDFLLLLCDPKSRKAALRQNLNSDKKRVYIIDVNSLY